MSREELDPKPVFDSATCHQAHESFGDTGSHSVLQHFAN
jgi:hypothetical protein